MLAVNQVLQQGRYRIIDEFGQNGIGAGYEAYDTVLKTNVLLKENWVNLGKVTTAAQMETLKVAFVNEAKILTELKHESLLEIQNYFAEIDRQYLVTEYADGDYLSELLEKTKSPFQLAKAARVADQLLDVLTYLHTRVPPIIHRGIRPQDIKLTSGGKVKLLIFGIAKNFGTKTNNDFKNQTFDTANMNYLPLEQIWEGLDAASQKVVLNSYDEESQKILELPADPRSDIYSLGATLYHLLTARRPIDALERSIEIMEGKKDPLPSPSEINSQVPTEISAVLMKALEIKREDRFSSAEVMRLILQSELSRVKEREEARSIESEDDDMLEIGFATMQKTFEPKPLRVEPEDSKAEAEKTRQMELMKQRLQEAEAQRLLAEQRAAEAEKRLLEREAEQITKTESFEEVVNSGEAPTSLTVALPENTPKASPVKFEKLDEVKEQDEFKDLFAEPQKENKSMRRMAVAAIILVMLGGTAWGVWTFLPAKQADTNQAVSFEEKNKPAPTVETVIAPTPEANQIPAGSSPETVETAVSTSAVKNKTAQPSPPQTKKTAATPAKTPAQKKPVTVDDLINDN
jgi:serine/threonine protein kinase